MMFLVILAGSSAASGWKGPQPPLGLLAALIGAADLVYAPGMKTRDHLILHQRFSVLLIETIRAGASVTQTQLDEWVARRIEIEADEPPIYWAVEKDCWNEVCKAWGRDKIGTALMKRSWRERHFMNYFRFDRADVAEEAH
jgi:hypothetical protein